MRPPAPFYAVAARELSGAREPLDVFESLRARPYPWLLESTLRGPMEQVDPVIAAETRLALLEARLAIRDSNPAAHGPSMTDLLAATRRLGDPDTFLWALIVELERRVATEGGESMDPVLQEYEELARLGGYWEQPYIQTRVGIVRAVALLQRERPRADLVADAFGYLRRLGRAGVWKEYRELLASIAGDHVAGTATVPQPAGDLA